MITGIIGSDPAGIQTQDLQNRNLTLYSAKLRGLFAYKDMDFIWIMIRRKRFFGFWMLGGLCRALCGAVGGRPAR